MTKPPFPLLFWKVFYHNAFLALTVFVVYTNFSEHIPLVWMAVLILITLNHVIRNRYTKRLIIAIPVFVAARQHEWEQSLAKAIKSGMPPAEFVEQARREDPYMLYRIASDALKGNLLYVRVELNEDWREYLEGFTLVMDRQRQDLH